MVLSVKGGNIRPTDLRDLRGVLEREDDAEMAGFISLREPTKAMREEASRAGNYEYSGLRLSTDAIANNQGNYRGQTGVSYANQSRFADRDRPNSPTSSMTALRQPADPFLRDAPDLQHEGVFLAPSFFDSALWHHRPTVDVLYRSSASLESGSMFDRIGASGSVGKNDDQIVVAIVFSVLLGSFGHRRRLAHERPISQVQKRTLPKYFGFHDFLLADCGLQDFQDE